MSRTETLVQIYTVGDAYAYTTMELKKAAFARQSLDAAKAMAARRIMEQKIDLLLQTGDAAYGMKGLLNQSGTNTYVVPNGGLGSPLWTQKTSDEILTDLNAMANAPSNATNGIEYPDTMVLPIAQYDLISQKPRSSTSDTTVKEFFLGNSPYIKEIIPWWPCKTAGAAGVTRAVTYRKDLEALWYYMPQEFQAMAPQLRNLEYLIPCTCDFGGVHVRLPKSVTYADGI